MSNPEPVVPQRMVVHPMPRKVVDPEPHDPDQTPAARARQAANAYVDASARALETNAGYLSIRNPNPNQTEAQVQALTRQINGLIQLLLAKDTVSDAANAGTIPDVPEPEPEPT